MSAVDVRKNLRMVLQHVLICGPDATVEQAIADVDDAVAELIEADREYDAACSELSEQENADDDDELYLSAVRRHQWARDRRAAALANIGAAP